MFQILLLNVYLNDLILFLDEPNPCFPAIENRQISLCLNADDTVLFPQIYSSKFIVASIDSGPQI